MSLRRHEVVDWWLQGGAIIIVTLLWSENMGGYDTPDTMVEIGA